MQHSDQQIEALAPELQRKMATLVLAGWRFHHNPTRKVWVSRDRGGYAQESWYTLSICVERTWTKFQLEEQA